MSLNRKLGNYPSFLIVVSLTVALFLTAFCGWLALISKELLRNIRQNIEVQAYLDKSLTQIQIDSVRNVISTRSYVEVSNAVPQIKFISKEATAEKILKETKEDYRSLLGENPYRDAFTFRVKETFFSEENLAKIKLDLEQIGGVYEADYVKDLADSITKNTNKAYIIISTIVLVLLIAIIVLVNNTIRLALYAQRFIIRSMKLVGATDWFIQKPFLIRGILQGLLAGSLACLLLFILQQVISRNIQDFVVIQDNTKIFILFGLIILLGILIGLISTFQSIYRYLRTDLEDLY